MALNDKICPLCGEANGCQAGTGNRCWCNDIKVPKELLDLIPSDLRNKSCVCRGCIEKFNSENR